MLTGHTALSFEASNLELAQYWDDVAEEIDRKLVRRPDP